MNPTNLEETFFLDKSHENVKNFIAKLNLENLTDLEKVLKIYFALRDQIVYDPYHIVLRKEELKASRVLERGYGYCVEKSLTFATLLRSIGVPARLGFANVKNHLNSKRLQTLMQSDVFVYHGYTEVFLNEKWVKATPAFNLRLCERAGIKPLDFDGIHDSIFHSHTNSGSQHMEYLHDYGTFSDLPFDKMIDEYDKYYPHLKIKEKKTFGDFAKVKFEDELIK